MRKIFVFAIVFALAEIAAAQIPTSGNVFFGYSYFNTNLNGDRNSLNLGRFRGSKGPASHRAGRGF